MRSRQAFKNMIANILLQVLVFTSGIILPRFFLEAYGSSVNGMITSVNQFLAYLGLAEAGVGTASVVALYQPLAADDKAEISSILSATRKFYQRSSGLFLALVLVLAVAYPALISQQLDHTEVRCMVLVLASSTLVDYFFLGKYRVLLTANQEGYVVALIQSVGTVVNMVASILLIYLGAQVVVVKVVATGVYMLRLVLVRGYVKKNYKELDYYAAPNMRALHQKGAALMHQVVGIIVNNTDVVMLTVFLGSRSLLEVSVYGIYNLVVSAVNLLLTSFSNGLTAGFGEVISRGEEKVLKESYSEFEYIYLIILFIVVVCMGTLFLPFVGVYTTNMTDVNYIRPGAALLFTLIVFLQNVRIPGLTIICAAGHYKQTRYQAILEAVINIAVSIALVWKFKMAGVLFGTVCSYGYRSIDIIFYNHRHLIKGAGKTIIRIFRNLAVSAVLLIAGLHLIPQEMPSFAIWFGYGTAYLIGVASAIILINFIAEPDQFRQLIRRGRSVFSRK